MRIRTTYEHPPIPDRRWDWSAIDEDTYDGAEDSFTRHQIGRGATQREAVADLLEQLADTATTASLDGLAANKDQWPMLSELVSSEQVPLARLVELKTDFPEFWIWRTAQEARA